MNDEDFDWDLECLERADRRGIAKRLRDRDSLRIKEMSEAIKLLKEVVNSYALESIRPGLHDRIEDFLEGR